MKKLLLLFSFDVLSWLFTITEGMYCLQTLPMVQIIEWGKQYVVHSIEDGSKEGESYKIMEWILAEKRQVFPLRGMANG